MVNLNGEIVYLKNENNLLKGETPEEIMLKGNELNDKLHKRWLMISGEGTVFITLLLLGIVQIRKTFKKEEELNLQQKNFLLSVTHELKSPIASAKLQLQTMQKHELSREKQKELIGNAINDTDRLHTLVENILLAAKIENNIISDTKADADISELIGNVIQKNIQSFTIKQNVVFDIEPNIHLKIDPTNFTSIPLNLFENAVKYSKGSGTINVSLKKQNNKVLFSISDQGTGINEKDKQAIFKKFYRVGNEETRNTKGTGLGLFIVNHLVKQHNGSITVKDNVPRGSIFEVEFIS